MASFVTPLPNDDAIAEHVAQLTEDFQGLRNIPLSVTGINDAASYSLTLKNAGAGAKGLIIYAADGTTVLLQADAAGVKGSADGVTPAVGLVTLTGAQTLTQKTLTSPHMTGAVVDSGGLTVTAGGATITAGGLTVTAGNVGIGTTPLSNIGADTLGLVLTGGTQVAFAGRATGDATGTSEVTGFYGKPQTSATAYTCTTVADFHGLNPVKGAGSTITSAFGLLIDPITSGNTNNYGINIGAPSGGSGSNIGLNNEGSTRLVGNLGFYGTTPIGKISVGGSRAGNAALTNLLTTLNSLGLLSDISTA